MLAIQAGKLIDGISDAPLSDVIVLIEGERITEVGAAATLPIPAEAEVIDARHLTVMPGLIDVHVHVHTLGGPVANYALSEAQALQGELALLAYHCVQRDLEMGITTLRSVGSPAYVDIALRNSIQRGLVTGPRLQVAGQGLSITGGHMDKPYWSPDVHLAGRTGVCDGPWACRAAAREQIKRGADWIKINACSGGVAEYRLDPPWVQEMTYEEMAAICDEAHRLNRRVVAHTSGGQGITDAIQAGVNSLEHAHWLSDEQIELMLERGTFYVPTLIVNTRSVELGRERKDVGGDSWRWLNKVYAEKWESLERAKQAGVKIGAGSDAGFVVYHGEVACEIEELVKGGFTPMEALIAATRVNAECMGLEEELGTIEAGKIADIVLLDGDPLADIRILQDKARIVRVLQSGQTARSQGNSSSMGL